MIGKRGSQSFVRIVLRGGTMEGEEAGSNDRLILRGDNGMGRLKAGMGRLKASLF